MSSCLGSSSLSSSAMSLPVMLTIPSLSCYTVMFSLSLFVPTLYFLSIFVIRLTLPHPTPSVCLRPVIARYLSQLRLLLIWLPIRPLFTSASCLLSISKNNTITRSMNTTITHFLKYHRHTPSPVIQSTVIHPCVYCSAPSILAGSTNPRTDWYLLVE